MAKCNYDCLNCIYEDCINDDPPQANENPDVYNDIRIRRKTYGKPHKDSEAVARAKKRWLDNHKEYMKEYQKKYRETHKEKAAAYQKEYRKKYRR